MFNREIRNQPECHHRLALHTGAVISVIEEIDVRTVVPVFQPREKSIYHFALAGHCHFVQMLARPRGESVRVVEILKPRRDGEPVIQLNRATPAMPTQ